MNAYKYPYNAYIYPFDDTRGRWTTLERACDGRQILRSIDIEMKWGSDKPLAIKIKKSK